MNQHCPLCQSAFEITSDDLAFYEKVSPTFNGKKELIPPPTLCPDCRQQRRLAFRNERCLYHRKCDLTGRQMITMYSPDKPYKIYDQEAWWSDNWDPLATGRSYDPAQSFFKQFDALFHEAPRISLINMNHQNAEYCNFALKNKNSYLLFTSAECEDSLYMNRSWRSRNCADCSSLEDGELCYEVLNSDHCYNCLYLQNCANCSDCYLGYNLHGCKNCFACYGLTNASYCIGNKKFEKAEYEEAVGMLRKDIGAVRENFEDQKRAQPRKYMDCINADSCTGNAISHSKHALNCFEVMNVEDCNFVCNATFMKDAYDVNNDDHSELVYEAVGSETNSMHAFNDICWFNREVLYSSLCFRCKNCFGCIGLKHKQYCILNKQYSKDEYEKLVPTIIDHMRHDGGNGFAMNRSPSTALRVNQATGSWGEFFPVSISPFGYNETMAEEHFTLSKEEILARGWKWHQEEDLKDQYLGPQYQIPDSIADVPDDVTKQILRCSVTGKPYKIIPQELKFYRDMNIPIPRKCPNQRHRERIALRNPRRLWDRGCAKCGKGIVTSYAPERPEQVLCEECYLTAVY
ncbi:MAG: hypothetical protein PHZ00_04245 [Candidatus Peribacteraceae bacterium]|nr:hypothetical protein [Candidatus Peribacteraceae bacterium]